MRSSIGTDIAAPASLVFALARDVTAWADLLPHYVRSQRLSGPNEPRLCEFVARRPLVPVLGIGLPVVWRSRCWSEAARPDETFRLRFAHVAGATRGMDVTWRISPAAGGCRVTIDHEFRRPLPLVGDGVFPWLVDRLLTRAVAGRTLRSFRSIAEAVATATWSPDPIQTRSARADQTGQAVVANPRP
jgi:aromatase